MSDKRICFKSMGIGPSIGSVQAASPRMCKDVIGVGPRIGYDGVIIAYGTSGPISYGTSGTIIY